MSTQVGYTGGRSKAPTYQSVCAGDGHSESLQIQYDPTKIKFETLVDKFLEFHDPSRVKKTQYMSAVWPHDHVQESVTKSRIANWNLTAKKKAVTRVISPPGTFHKAEEYHQQYIAKKQLEKGIKHQLSRTLSDLSQEPAGAPSDSGKCCRCCVMM